MQTTTSALSFLVGLAASRMKRRPPSFAFTPPGHKEDVVFVRATDALRLCHEGSHECIPPWRVDAPGAEMGLRATRSLRDFLAESRLTAMPLSSLDNRRLALLFKKALQAKDVVAVRTVQSAAGKGAEATADQRRMLERRKLVRAIERNTRGVLNHSGRKYKVVSHTELATMANRDSYEVVPNKDAAAALDTIATQATTHPHLASLLVKAKQNLSPDWRPPLSPDGLVLLRRASSVVAHKAVVESPISPSQFKAMLAKPEVLEGVAAKKVMRVEPDLVVPRLFYEDDPKKPVRNKYVWIDGAPIDPVAYAAAAVAAAATPSSSPSPLAALPFQSLTGAGMANVSAMSAPASSPTKTAYLSAKGSLGGTAMEALHDQQLGRQGGPSPESASTKQPLVMAFTVGIMSIYSYARTDENGYLCTIADGSTDPAAPFWIERKNASHRLFFADMPFGADSVTSPMCQAVTLAERDYTKTSRTAKRKGKAVHSANTSEQEYVYLVKRLLAHMNLAVSFQSITRTQQWLQDNPIRVDIDGQQAEASARVDTRTKIVVEFRVVPGRHEIVISTAPLVFQNNGQHAAIAGKSKVAKFIKPVALALDEKAAKQKASPVIKLPLKAMSGWKPATRVPDEAKRSILVAAQFTIGFSA